VSQAFSLGGVRAIVVFNNALDIFVTSGWSAGGAGWNGNRSSAAK
jgi:hypothetical protein